MRDRQLFQREHADSLVVVSAYGAWASWVPKGFVGCHAYVGGRNERGHTKGACRAFLVPAAEYDVRSQHGFVSYGGTMAELTEVRTVAVAVSC